MRYLAIDVGDKRTGLAVGDDLTRFVTPAGVLEIPRGPRLIEALAVAATEHAAEALVIGLPLNMDDSEGPAAKAMRDFGDELARRCGRRVHYQDERLTSFDADQRMARTGRTRGDKKKLRDALAAATMLSDWLAGEARS